jgi:3-oxoacyl-[acyl-carrier protein] reductase
MDNFKDKVVFITGSSRGLGRELAKGFAQKEAIVIINGRSYSADLKSLEEELKSLNVKYLTIVGDVATDDFAKDSIKKIIDTFGKLDILINNAGITKDNLVLNMDVEDFNEVINVNLNAPFRLIKESLPYMIEQRYGKIINISSVSSILSQIGQASYSSSKAGLNSLTKVVAKEVGRYNININSIAPAYIDTDIIKTVPVEMLTLIKKNHPLRRFAKTTEIANLVYFLSSDLCPYLHGETIVVDGAMV